MTVENSSDIQKAQEIAFRAFLKIAKLPKVKADAFLLTAIVLCAYTRVTAELAALGQTILDTDGIDRIIASQCAEFTKYLREDLETARATLLHEAAEAKKS